VIEKMAAWSFKRAFESELTDAEDGAGVGRHRSTATGISAEGSTVNDSSTASGTGGLPVFSEDETNEEGTSGRRHNNTANGNNEDGMELIEQGEDFTSVQSCEVKNGHWICKPYKREMIAQQFENNSPGASRRTAIIGALRDLGVKVFIIEAKSIKSTKDILHHVKRVVGFVAKENRIQVRTGPLGFQRCLLYQDQQGRLFNLMLAKHAIGPASKYQDYLDTFSGLQAMVAIVVLCRSFPCATSSADIEQLKPAFLSLILGIVFTEELSLSYLNASMLVRASPSVSAHTLTNNVGSDVLRKLIVLSLALAAAASGMTQKILTLFGISAACAVFLSNLGSRAWHFMRWRPLRYQGLGAGFVAWVVSIMAGLCIPYMGHRSIEIGGKAALEHVLMCAFAVAITFVVSDIDEIQKFLIVGSEVCNQDFVNIAVGGWWCFTLICSLFLVRKIPYKDHHPYYDGEPLLVEDHASPVGYKVPSIPDFEIDPSLAKTGSSCIPYSLEFIVGFLMALVVGGGIVYLAFTDVDEQIVGTMQNVTKAVGSF
jgi:hypothetical protein